LGINLAGFKNLFYYLFQTFNDHAPRLNALDSAIGDGDHGDTMLRGFRAAARTVREGSYSSISELFDAVADSLAEETGGAIGPLLAAFFAEGGLAFSGMEGVNVSALALFFKRGLDAVKEVGGAQPGDKTLVDALAPAVNALVESQGADLVTALRCSRGGCGARRTSHTGVCSIPRPGEVPGGAGHRSPGPRGG
jgi:dihydroxyacetone kinase